MKDLYRLFEMIMRLEEAHQITFHQRYINFLMIEVYKYLNGHSPDIMNIFKFRENLCHNLRNIHIFQTEKSSFIEIQTRCYSILC